MKFGLLLSCLFTVVAATASAQRPLAEFDNEARHNIRKYRREKAGFSAPERQLTAIFALGDTLRSASGWHLIRMYEPGGTFSTPIRIDQAQTCERGKLYVHNASLEVVLYHPADHLTPPQVEALADSLRNSTIRLEQCTTDNALNAPQNCASYAIECVLRAHGFDPAPFFTWETHVEEESLAPLLDRLMSCTRILTVPENRNQWARETRFTQNALYVCHNASGQAVHVFFYRDGHFWSKNGSVFSHVVYDSVLSVLKHYSQTVSLREYTLRKL